MFEDLRRKVMAAYKTAHDINYPLIPVNYPGKALVDPENRVDPFVVVGLVFSNNRQFELGNRNIRIHGELLVNFYYRPGTGMSSTSEFSDFLLTNFSMYTINNITFREVRPYHSAARDGWEGTLNVIPFTVEYYNV